MILSTVFFHLNLALKPHYEMVNNRQLASSDLPVHFKWNNKATDIMLEMSEPIGSSAFNLVLPMGLHMANLPPLVIILVEELLSASTNLLLSASQILPI